MPTSGALQCLVFRQMNDKYCKNELEQTEFIDDSESRRAITTTNIHNSSQ